MLEDMELDHSILAAVGNAVAWIFIPLGWGDWKSTVAAITGLVAKENVVGTFGILYGFAEVAEDGSEIWGSLAGSMTTAAAYSFLVFNLLCAPCFAAMGAIKREMNNAKWFWFAIGYQTGLAYVVSLCVYQLGTLFTAGTFGIGTAAAVLLVIGFVYLLVRPYKESKTLNVKIRMAGAKKFVLDLKKSLHENAGSFSAKREEYKCRILRITREKESCLIPEAITGYRCRGI